jgi:hypothetical protein
MGPRMHGYATSMSGGGARPRRRFLKRRSSKQSSRAKPSMSSTQLQMAQQDVVPSEREATCYHENDAACCWRSCLA